VSAQRLEIATVERGPFVRDIVADSRVVAAVSPMLYAAAPGTVTLKVHAGDAVGLNALLATVASPELSAHLAQEEATLQSQQLDYRHAQLDADRQQLRAQDALQQAQVDQKTAQREVERSRKAHELGAYSELQLLRAQDALEKADFSLQQAQKDADLQPQQNRFDLDSRKAQIERQQSVVNDLRRQVAALDVRSPVAGQVGQIAIADRASVARDAALLSVVDLSRLELEMKVPESFARDLAVGMPAQVSGNGAQWDAEVGSVSPEVIEGQVTARVRFKGATPQGLRQNQRLTVRVLIDHKDDAITVARGNWYDQGGGHTVYVVNDGVAERREVRSGAVSVDKVEILEGLQPGERIVAGGADIFADQPRVIISR
jgi:HlyD family secretion protein